MRHQQTPPPLVALTAVLAAAVAILELTLAPLPLLPRLAVALIASLAVTAVTARATGASIPRLACAVTLVHLRAATLTLQTITAALLHLIGLAEQWLTRALTTQPTVYATAA
jgi:hypothetical protein